jgi:hypothetical protein
MPVAGRAAGMDGPIARATTHRGTTARAAVAVGRAVAVAGVPT